MNKKRILRASSAGLLHLQPFELPILGVIPVPFLLTSDKNSANWTAEQVADHMAAQRRLSSLGGRWDPESRSFKQQ